MSPCSDSNGANGSGACYANWAFQVPVSSTLLQKVGCRSRRARKLSTHHARPFEPSIKSHFLKSFSTSGDNCPQTGSKTAPRAPRPHLGCPHEWPSVDPRTRYLKLVAATTGYKPFEYSLFESLSSCQRQRKASNCVPCGAEAGRVRQRWCFSTVTQVNRGCTVAAVLVQGQAGTAIVSQCPPRPTGVPRS